MCYGTYVVSYSCGHVVSTPNVCLRDVDAHYCCEPRGMKITQPPGRCIECYARELEPGQLHLTTTVRFNPDLSAEQNDLSSGESKEVTPRSSADSERADAIVRWKRERWVDKWVTELNAERMNGSDSDEHEGVIHKSVEVSIIAESAGSWQRQPTQSPTFVWERVAKEDLPWALSRYR
ncbi:hypothetical protein AC578_6623 [Pseudocercospora eumusae]|uniref:Uncharacterized protein n=1 Tax=Pseudocercospora eumusae TaxID=321146 RepID=A0A139HG16_9PEZI|nr:hypothetical protein AC578_6623 [Pseudocercospora eumusae]